MTTVRGAGEVEVEVEEVEEESDPARRVEARRRFCPSTS